MTYVVNHGSNQSEVNVKDSLKWRLYFKLQIWKRWTADLDNEFGVSLRLRAGGIYEAQTILEWNCGASRRDMDKSTKLRDLGPQKSFGRKLCRRGNLLAAVG